MTGTRMVRDWQHLPLDVNRRASDRRMLGDYTGSSVALAWEWISLAKGRGRSERRVFEPVQWMEFEKFLLEANKFEWPAVRVKRVGRKTPVKGCIVLKGDRIEIMDCDRRYHFFSVSSVSHYADEQPVEAPPKPKKENRPCKPVTERVVGVRLRIL